MLNQINEGKTIVYTNQDSSNPILKGTAVYLGAGVAGIAVDTIAANGVGVLQLEGVYSLPKKTATDVIAVGDPVELDSGKVKKVTIGSASTAAELADIIGIAVENSISAATTAKILLK